MELTAGRGTEFKDAAVTRPYTGTRALAFPCSRECRSSGAMLDRSAHGGLPQLEGQGPNSLRIVRQLKVARQVQRRKPGVVHATTIPNGVSPGSKLHEGWQCEPTLYP